MRRPTTIRRPLRGGQRTVFPDIDQLLHEHGVLLRRYAALQQRCTAQAEAQQQETAQLHALVTRLRAQLIARDSALLWEREDRQQQLAAVAMRSAVQALQHCLEPTPSPLLHTSVDEVPDSHDDQAKQRLQHSQRAAELVICQTGCISHGNVWRDDELCKRSGTTCLLQTPSTTQSTPS